MGRTAIDLVGKRIGKLVVIKRIYDDKYCGTGKHAKWLCKCACGNETIILSHMLLSGKQKSCGCLLVDMHKTHGNSKTRLYNIWNGIKQRCFNPNNKEFKDYGGRGISVCDEWKSSYEIFAKWAFENGYNEYKKRGECTIDRIDNNGNYEPSNCRWVSMKVQAQNRCVPNNWKKRKEK